VLTMTSAVTRSGAVKAVCTPTVPTTREAYTTQTAKRCSLALPISVPPPNEWHTSAVSSTPSASRTASRSAAKCAALKTCPAGRRR